MVVHGKSEFVKTYSAEPRLFATESDQFFVPSIEDTVYFDIKHLPTQFASVVTSITAVFFSLQCISC